MPDKKKKSIVGEVMGSLIDGGGMLFDWASNPYAFRREMRGGMSSEEWDAIFRKNKEARALKQMQHKGWVQNHQEGEQVIYLLSKDAIIEGVKHKVRTNTQQLPGGYETVIIFDFPEAAKSARTTFRRFLKSSGFEQKQLSVWTTKSNVTSEIHQLIKLLGIEKWASVLLAQTIC